MPRKLGDDDRIPWWLWFCAGGRYPRPTAAEQKAKMRRLRIKEMEAARERAAAKEASSSSEGGAVRM
jgi:hypothetical protein